MPVVGSALTIHKVRKEKEGYLYLATAELAKQHNTGCVGLRIGKDRTVVCISYDSIKEMLTKEDFDGRPQGPFYETRTWGVRRGKETKYHYALHHVALYKFSEQWTSPTTTVFPNET